MRVVSVIINEFWYLLKLRKKATIKFFQSYLFNQRLLSFLVHLICIFIVHLRKLYREAKEHWGDQYSSKVGIFQHFL